MTMQDEQAPILQDIADALIRATPPHWHMARLELTQSLRDNLWTLQHRILNTDHPRDIVVATDELLHATNQLQLLHESYKQVFKRVTVEVVQQDSDWRFSAEWEY